MIPRDKPPYYVAWDYAENQPRDATCYLCARLAVYIRARLCGCIKILRAPRHGDDRVFSRKIFLRASPTTRRKLRKLRVRKGACAGARTHFIIFALTAPWQTSWDIFMLSKGDPLKHEKYFYLYLHCTKHVEMFAFLFINQFNKLLGCIHGYVNFCEREGRLALQVYKKGQIRMKN